MLRGDPSHSTRSLAELRRVKIVIIIIISYSGIFYWMCNCSLHIRYHNHLFNSNSKKIIISIFCEMIISKVKTLSLLLSLYVSDNINRMYVCDNNNVSYNIMNTLIGKGGTGEVYKSIIRSNNMDTIGVAKVSYSTTSGSVINECNILRSKYHCYYH